VCVCVCVCYYYARKQHITQHHKDRKKTQETKNENRQYAAGRSHSGGRDPMSKPLWRLLPRPRGEEDNRGRSGSVIGKMGTEREARYTNIRTHKFVQRQKNVRTNLRRWPRMTRRHSAVASLPALGPWAPPSRTGPLARKYLPGFPYS